MNSYMGKELVQQTAIEMSLKIRFDHDDGSHEELLGRIDEGKIHFNNNMGFLDFLISYKNLIMPLPYITVFIGIRDNRHDNIIWFTQGKFRVVGDYSYTDLESKQLHFVALNNKDKYSECVMLQKEDTLDNEFIQSILISESKDLFYDINVVSHNDFYITTKLFPTANRCKEVEFKRMNDTKVRKYEVKEFLHDIGKGTTKWHLTKVNEEDK